MKSLPEYLGYPRVDLDDPEFQDMYVDYAKGLLTGGIISGYKSLHAAARGDWDEVAYWTRVELAVLGTQYTAIQFLNMIQGPKYAMSFHRAHASMGPARGIIARAIAVPLALPGTVFYGAYKAGTSPHVKAAQAHASKHGYTPSRYRYAASRGAWKKSLRDS
jgi:hypothetical protein